jgi:hypothetical protein
MNKIPVGATIAHAWRFVVRDFLNILGVSVPVLVLSWIPSFLIYAPGAAHPQAAMGGDPARAAHLLPMLLPLYLAIFLLMGMQLLGIAELASGTKRSPRWLYLSLKWPVWRLFGSMLFLILVIFLAVLLVALGYGAFALLLKLAFNNAAGWALTLSSALHLVGGIAAFCAYVYCLVRLTFLLIPMIAAEEPGFAVARSWALGAGNFWRMFALLLTVWIPLFVLEGILIVTMFAGVHFPPPHASPAQAAAFQAAMNAHGAQVFSNMFTYWYISAPLFVAIMVLFYGFAIGSQVFAYEALKGGDLTPVAGD